MDIKPLEKKDLDHLSAMQPDGWSDIKPAIRFYLSKAFCHVIKSGKAGDIMGIGAGIAFGSTAWLAHIIVAKEHRGKGIARGIVDHLIKKLIALGCGSISLIATPMGFPVYERSGFKTQTDYVFYKREGSLKDQNALEDGGSYPEQIIPYSPRFQNQVYALDKAISGENRQSILEEKLHTSVLYQENKKITGLFVPDLGEGMIIALNTEAGIALMKRKYADAHKAVLPMDNQAGAEFLRKNGFSETERAARMIWGKPLLWQPDKIYSRIAGKLG